MLEKIMNDKEISSILNNINEAIIKDNCGDHGVRHALTVMNYVEILLRGLKATEKEIELGKIAAYLHDVGAIDGKQGHAIRSSEFVEEYLTKLDFSECDKHVIVHAIKNHSAGDNLESIIGACLTLADKSDMCKGRMLRYIEGNYFHDNIKHMLDVALSIDENNIYINIITDGHFDYNSLRDYKKMINKPVEMSKYLNRNCIFLIDGEEMDLYTLVN